jgi:succinate dehydrogenase / fumarate reductase cytochrome b subunit
MSQTGWTDKRPMSPHVSVWRWHATMLGSILHRATGVGNYIGAILAVAWLSAAASGEDTYNQFADIIAHPLGQLALFGFTLSVVYHIVNGIRHLFLDAGKGLQPKLASATATLTVLIAVLASAAIWIFAGLVPGVTVGG